MIDAVGTKHSGGSVVLLELVRAALAAPAIARVTVFATPRALRDFDLPREVDEHEITLAEAPVARRVVWYEYALARKARSVGADLLVCMAGMGQGGSVPHVTFIQQSLPFCPEALARMSRVDRARFRTIRLLMGRSARTSRRVYVQTPTMAAWVHDSLHVDEPRWHIPTPRVFPVIDGPDPLAAGARGARLLYVGNDAGYKNVAVAMGGIEILRREIPEATLFVTWPLDRMLPPGVVALGRLDLPTLRRAYAGADLLVQPSLVETVGLAANEAMSLGLPVLTADRPYARDTCAEAAFYFDPLSPVAFARGAQQALCDKVARKKNVDLAYALIEARRREAPYCRLVEALIDETKT